MKKLEKIERKIDSLNRNGVAVEEETELLYKGVNIHRIPAQNPYSYGLHLMDALFEKDELAASLMFESAKSDKPGLDKERVAKIFKMIKEKFKGDERYQKEFDTKLFIRKANQKMPRCYKVLSQT